MFLSIHCSATCSISPSRSSSFLNANLESCFSPVQLAGSVRCSLLTWKGKRGAYTTSVLKFINTSRKFVHPPVPTAKRHAVRLIIVGFSLPAIIEQALLRWACTRFACRFLLATRNYERSCEALSCGHILCLLMPGTLNKLPPLEVIWHSLVINHINSYHNGWIFIFWLAKLSLRAINFSTALNSVDWVSYSDTSVTYLASDSATNEKISSRLATKWYQLHARI